MLQFFFVTGFAANIPTDSLMSTSDEGQTSLPLYTIHDTTSFRNTKTSTYVGTSTTLVPQITTHATIQDKTELTLTNVHSENNEQTTSMEMSSANSTSGCSDLYSGCKDLIQVLDICNNSTQAKECLATCKLCHLNQSGEYF